MYEKFYFFFHIRILKLDNLELKITKGG